MVQSENIAILFFSRSASAESRSKKWFRNGNHGNFRIAKTLITKTITTLQQTELPVFQVHEKLQRGTTFGARITNAFSDIFAQGFEYVICVGNDSPDLNRLDWQTLIKTLEKQTPILGATLSNGAYCIAIPKKLFNPTTFEALPWQSQKLFDALQNHFETYHCLPALADINTLDDLRTFLKTQNGISILFNWLYWLLASTCLGYVDYFKILKNYYFSTLYSRPPPLPR